MKIVESNIPKVTVHITRKEMWENYMKTMTDMGKEMPSTDIGNHIENMHQLLLGPINIHDLRKAFASGETYFLIPGIDEKFNTDCHCEIIVDDTHTIHHEDINF